MSQNKSKKPILVITGSRDEPWVQKILQDTRFQVTIITDFDFTKIPQQIDNFSAVFVTVEHLGMKSIDTTLSVIEAVRRRNETIYIVAIGLNINRPTKILLQGAGASHSVKYAYNAPTRLQRVLDHVISGKFLLTNISRRLY